MRRSPTAHFWAWVHIAGTIALPLLAIWGLLLIATAIADYSAHWRTTEIAAEGPRP